ncbi:MAG TPA: uroporphyrinogen-III C-methyltransferase [Candidatus Binatia bacterium]|nr:uroporphyrinogen-III C-methyltransferase [Candidatus Binatia bacterium]
MSAGRVVLVGAGPGDPGLLTLSGQRHLAAADVVVHDHLVPPRLLEHVRPDAEVIAVGAPHGTGTRLAQAEIVALLIARARAGRYVVRLKNGDPFLFGRGAEEAQALHAAGVPFEVVPGVTSALAAPAFAGIPATHREHASLVTIATGHQATCAAGPPALPWAALARQGGTLIFLMGMRQVEAICTQLLAHGLDPATPAAAVRRGTLGGQASVVATVATLAERVRAAGLGPPGVLVVGPVVRLREELRWFERRPLFGRRVVVTRARAQAGDLARLLEEQGAETIVFPTILIAPPPDPGPLARAVAAAGSYDWIVFTSANGVRAVLGELAARGGDVRALAGVRLAAIGPETAAELGRHLLRAAVVAAEYRAEGLLAALGGDLAGRRVLLPRAAGARPVLPETLAARGAHVDEVIAYRAVPPPGADVAGMRAALAAGTVDALTFTSSSTVRNFVALVGRDALAPAAGRRPPVVACIGPVTAATARGLGLAVAVEPQTYTVPALAAALAEYFCNARGDALSRGSA